MGEAKELADDTDATEETIAKGRRLYQEVTHPRMMDNAEAN